MARREISIKTVNEETLNGFAWECENPEGTFFIATGMEEYALRYDDFANFLNKNNFNVYCIDYYGQGENVQDEKELGIVPRSAFSKFVRVLDDLVRHYSLKNKPIVVFGHSMGSFLIQDYIQRYSKHATHAIIMGTDGPNSSFTYKIGYQLARFISKVRGENRQAKLLRSMAVGSYAKAIKDKKTNCDWLSFNEDNVNKYIADPKCGHPSTNGFYRELLKGNHRLYKSKFLKKVSKDLNIMIPCGEYDPVGKQTKGPKKLYSLYKELGIKNVKLSIYKGMRHEILNERDNNLVYLDILNFIK